MSSTRPQSRAPTLRLSIARALALALLFGLLGSGCATAPAEAPPARATTPSAGSDLREAMRAGPVAAEPLFWRTEADGGATLHLLGSIHFGPPRGWVLPPRVEDAFARSTALVIEADDRDIDEAAMHAIMVRHALAPPGTTLADLVPADTLRDLEAHMSARGQGMSTLLPFRPWMVATVVTMGTVAELGFSSETGVDHGLLTRVADREVIALETVESQLSIFGRLSPELDALFLRDTLDQLGDAGEMLLEMAEAWRSGDEPELARLMTESFDEGNELEALHDALIVERNLAMAGRLAALARDPDRAGQEVFVVLGAAHFVGEKNIRDILAAEHGLHVTTTAPPAAEEPHVP